MPDVVGLEDVVSRALSGLAEGDRVQLDLPDDLPAVRVDAGLLDRVVANLVDNALRHTDAGVRVDSGVTDDRAWLRVVDHGPGVPAADHESLFEPFQRLGDAPAGEGVGLGLAVARGLTEAMGGTLTASDTPGGGLTMTVSLPAVPSRAAARAGPAVTSVLVVDDDPAIQRTLAIGLRARGYDVLPARDGRTAVDACHDDEPDVVLLDLGLPDLSGVEVLRTIRAWSQVPVIVLSARHGSDDKVEALDVGADDYVTKPFGMDELLARVRAAVRRAVPDQPPAPVVTDAFTVDLAATRVYRDGRGGPAHPDRVAAARGAGDPARPAGVAAPAAQRGLGAGVHRRDQLPAGLPRRTAPQARGRPVPAAAPGHRARHGLPLPPLIRQR